MDHGQPNLAKRCSSYCRAGKPLSKENLEATYVARRRASWVEEEGRIAEKARDGFHHGMIPGLLGMAIAGFTDGKHSVSGEPKPMPGPEEYYRETDSRRRTGKDHGRLPCARCQLPRCA